MNIDKFNENKVYNQYTGYHVPDGKYHWVLRSRRFKGKKIKTIEKIANYMDPDFGSIEVITYSGKSIESLKYT